MLRRQRLIATAGMVVALIATSGSLFFSLGWGMIPCHLCWYQRILMYPLVLILGFSAVRGIRLHEIVIPMAGLGIVISGYHSWLQRFAESSSCTQFSCAAIQFELFGVFSIPNLALIAFAMIFILSLGELITPADWTPPFVGN